MSNAEFTLLLTENADFLKPFAINLTKDHEAAKDLFQETLYRALSNKDKYNVGTNIKAWLYTIMRNIFINDYRKKAKQSVVLDNSPTPISQIPTSFLQKPTKTPSPDSYNNYGRVPCSIASRPAV